MKLKLLFIVMDFLIVLAYPIVYVHGKLRQFSNKNTILAYPLPIGSLVTVDMKSQKITNNFMKGFYAYRDN